ncbi:endo-beta-glucanase [Diplodia corticola]|uniref:Endo-beta-glucanase n=1 Tax=Diplodia corticola TaxID=236234 RepID=A0A1J9RJ10_9PEZI|nr:endo-beta-glucanase [Diplodia corticola]OJD32547.1 endo-beta-glucanase [Diplodia corticola]
MSPLLSPRRFAALLPLSLLLPPAQSSTQFSALLADLPTLKIETTGSKITYTRDALWSGADFFSHFDFKTSADYMSSAIGAADPTHGFVHYVDEPTARNTSLIDTTAAGNPRWGVDTTHTYAPGRDWGRASVRLESKQAWTHGLFVFDIAHMPGATCGIWPALWSLGAGAWPAGGEVDVLENIHRAQANQMVVHTGDNCTLETPRRAALGGLEGSCAGSEGCRVRASTANSYGDAFNANGGGVYAMQWTSGAIKIWFFPRDRVDGELAQWLDADAAEGVDAAQFGLPQAAFAGGRGCDVDEHFVEHRLIFDTTFCGDWAGNAWPSTCPSVAGKKKKESCEIYVGAHPEAFEEAYWEINSIAVFKESEVVGTPV